MNQYITTYQKDYIWPQADASCNKPQSAPRIQTPCTCKLDGPVGIVILAKTGPSPESPASHFNQPSAYLKKTGPTSETITAVEQDRMMSTYQKDYTVARKRVNEQRENATAAAAHSQNPKAQPCPMDHADDAICCPPPSTEKIKQNMKQPCPKRTKKIVCNEDISRLPKWRTEYQDGISRLGHAIIKDKLHRRQPQLLTTQN